MADEDSGGWLYADITLPPGSVIVVGPTGEFRFRAEGHVVDRLRIIGCDFIGVENMSEAHIALVAEVWARRAHQGGETLPVDLRRSDDA